MAEWKGVLLPGGRLELMVKPRGATPTTLVSLLIDHIVAKASSTIFPYCMPIRFSEAIHSTIFKENRSSIFLSHLIKFICKQGMILYPVLEIDAHGAHVRRTKESWDDQKAG